MQAMGQRVPPDDEHDALISVSAARAEQIFPEGLWSFSWSRNCFLAADLARLA